LPLQRFHDSTRRSNFPRNLTPNFRLYICNHNKTCHQRSSLNKTERQKNMTTLFIRNSINRSRLRCRLLLTGTVLSFGLLALAPATQAACQDGCLGTENTTLGIEALASLTTGSYNTAVGGFALASITTGEFNTAVGSGALSHSVGTNINTAVGYNALGLTTTGADNTATGTLALYSNTTGSRNVATGSNALGSNQTGIDNTATGTNALAANTGDYNTATGYQALESNTTGTNNSAHGLDALNANTVGSGSTANGAYALFNNTFGNNNTASGFNALYTNTTGISNVANGGYALYSNINGSFNVADGWKTLYNNTSGADNIAIGNVAGFNLTIGSDNIEIGNEGAASDSGVIRIGNQGTQIATYIAGIRGVAVAGAQPVGVNASGQLGVRASSARFKEAVKPMDKASEAILALRPVTFRYKKELDPKATPQFGLVAEDVAKIAPELVVADDQGKPFSVRYEEVNAMLLNEFLKEHRKNEEQQNEIESLRAALKEQAARIQKVSAQLVAEKSVPILANEK
jgi:hypothetical protein